MDFYNAYSQGFARESVEIPAPVNSATRRPANKATSSGDSARAVTYSRVRTGGTAQTF